MSGERTGRGSRSRDAFRQRQNALEKKEREVGRKAGQEKPPFFKGFTWKHGALMLSLAALMLTGGYVYKAVGYRDTYFPHTVINGMDVSGKTVQEVKDLISAGVKDYRLTLKLRGDGKEEITGDHIGLHTVFDGSLEEIIRQQNPYAWPRYLLKGPSYDIETMIAYDDVSLDETLDALDCFDKTKVEPPIDAYLSDYTEGQGYRVVPETEGNALDEEKVKAAVDQGVTNLADQLDLDALGCYKTPSIRQDNPVLTAARDARNRYVNMTVTYTFGNRTEVLDGSEINQWLIVDGETVTLDQDKAAAYVKSLASRYNTAYTKRPFETSYGQTVELAGFYGWRINQAEETKELLAILEAGESVTREPVYMQTAASHDGPDYGNTYAEVNLTAQHLILYKDGEKVLESDFVSGNVSRGHTTPPGIFSITYKQRDAVLKGEGYASPVKFWMPFNGGIGFHDASWRSSFGGSIYKSGGSHGCVNMPYEAAKQLFEHIYAGMPVICYDLPGTESKKSSQAAGKAPQATAAPAQPAEPSPQPAQPVPEGTPPVRNPEVTDGAALPETSPQPAPPETGPQPTSPEVIIQPADQTTAAPTISQPSPGTSDGYGPAFDSTPGSGGEVGPGIS